MLYVFNNERQPIICRALLDTCSTANFIAEATVDRLKLAKRKTIAPISAIGNTSIKATGTVQITFQAIRGSFRKNLTCIILPTISNAIPSEVFPREAINIPANIQLADPEFHIPRDVDILIGSGVTLSLLSVGQINLTREEGDLYLQKTRLGWVIAGSAPASTAQQQCYLLDLESQLTKFWEIEETAFNKPRSMEEEKFEEHFNTTTTRNQDGRYVVRLPFRDSEQGLGDSRTSALKRLITLERKFERNPLFKREYVRVIEEYIQSNHLSLTETLDNNGYFMPHHAVIKDASDTTKVRVVFDASAKTTSGFSLNNLLMVGPTIQPKLTAHLLRIRKYRHVLFGDIEKMYRQVLIHENDRRYQQILWRVNNKITTLQLNIVTFGVSSSPFHAIRVLHQLADDERTDYPRAADVLTQHMYVDNLLSGADTIEEARAIRDEITKLLLRGGFLMRQWASDDPRIIDDLRPSVLHKSFTTDADRSIKTLGIIWRADDDKFRYFTRKISKDQRWSKRQILSEIARIFDPMGLLGPVILYAKGLMQDVWRCGIQWDASAKFIYRVDDLQ